MVEYNLEREGVEWSWKHNKENALLELEIANQHRIEKIESETR